jgi:hypothetical protein
MLHFILDRLKEKSTVTVIVTLAFGLLGVELSPEHVTEIVIAVASVASAVAIFTPSK